MKFRHLLAAMLLIAQLAAPLQANAAPQAKEAPPASVECSNSKAKVPTCRKKSDTSEPAQVSLRAKCVFTCSKDGNIWICRGNGSQCDGKSPWD